MSLREQANEAGAVRFMISSDAPVMLAKASELFIRELSLRASTYTEEQQNKRRTLQRQDFSSAIGKTDTYDFLIDIVPRDEPRPSKREKDAAAQQQLLMLQNQQAQQ
eukprot:7025-Heterococcus_DN1.PRE.2